MGKNHVTGIIVPLEASIIDRVFHHRPVIAIFARESPRDLEVGDRIFLYETGGGRVLLGEATVTGISTEKAGSVRAIGHELSVSPEELDEYVATKRKTGDDDMLVLKTKDAVKYSRALKWNGMKTDEDWAYLTDEVFKSIMSQNN
jgi:hypothetical protein